MLLHLCLHYNKASPVAEKQHIKLSLYSLKKNLLLKEIAHLFPFSSSLMRNGKSCPTKLLGSEQPKTVMMLPSSSSPPANIPLTISVSSSI